MIRSILSSLILSLLLVLLETALLSNIVILPAIPDLLLLAVLFVAVHNGSLVGETSGFFSGLFLDFLSAAPLGLNCLLRTTVGFVAGLFKNTLNVDGVFIPALLGFVATILKAILLQLIAFFFPSGAIVVYDIFSVSFITELVLNTVLSPIMFSILSLFSSFLVQNSVEQEL